MKKNIYAVYDRVAEMYGSLMPMINDKVAIRTFMEGCQKADGYKDHPEDLEIHRIGYFDDESGTFSMDKEILEKGEKNAI